MTDQFLSIVTNVTEAVMLGLLVVLCCMIWLRWRRRHTVSYLRSCRERGLRLLFSGYREEELSGLQLLARFGVGRPTDLVLIRLVELEHSGNPAIARLASKVLLECAAEARRRSGNVCVDASSNSEPRVAAR